MASSPLPSPYQGDLEILPSQETRHLRAIDDPTHPYLHIWPLSKVCPLASKQVQNPPTCLHSPAVVQTSVSPSQTLSQLFTSLLPLTAPVSNGRHGQVYITQTTPLPCSHILHSAQGSYSKTILSLHSTRPIWSALLASSSQFHLKTFVPAVPSTWDTLHGWHLFFLHISAGCSVTFSKRTPN